MTQEELAVFNTLLEKYLTWQCAKHDEAYREERNTPQEITERDCQAMHNFYTYGISLETTAEHFGCNVAFVVEQVFHRPWLRSRKNVTGTNLTWWESDHSDSLELVKLYYPHYLPENVSTETNARETCQHMTWQDYLDTVDWKEAYEQYGERASETIMETAQEIAARSNITLVFSDV